MGGFSTGGMGDWFSGSAGMGSQSEWDMFDNANFDSISNEGIGANTGSAFGGMFNGSGFENMNGVMDGMMSGGQQQMPQQGQAGMSGGLPPPPDLNRTDPIKRLMPQNQYVLDLLKRGY